MNSTNDLPNPGFFKRISAIVYDSLLVFAMLMAVTAAFLAIKISIFGTEAAPGVSKHALEQADRPYLFILLLLATYSFYVYFWTKHQCTLGMQAWRMRLVNELGENVSVKQASIRFFAVFVSILPCGLGYVWILLDRNNRAWHDHLSKTHLVIIPKAKS